MPYFVYLLANQPGGTLYVGVTNDLARRVNEHKEGKAESFTRKYKIEQLVYYETYERIEEAIAREKAMKKWNREWKIDRIVKMNPKWEDLSLCLNS